MPAMTAKHQQCTTELPHQAACDAEAVPVSHNDSLPFLLDSHGQQILSSSQGEQAGSYSLGSWAVLSTSQGLTPPLGGRVVPYPGDLGREPTFSPSPTSSYRKHPELPRHAASSSVCPIRSTVAAEHVSGAVLSQSSREMQTCTHHGQDPALKAASQALAGTSEWFWNEHGDQHVESGCASVTDAHNGATPTWEHALQLTLRETSSCSPAVDQQDDVSGTACASLQACAASKPAPRLALCNVSKDIKLEVKAPAADTAGCRSPQATVPDRTEADAHEPPEKVTAHQPWADQEMGQHDFAINPISNAEDIGQPAEDRLLEPHTGSQARQAASCRVPLNDSGEGQTATGCPAASPIMRRSQARRQSLEKTAPASHSRDRLLTRHAHASTISSVAKSCKLPSSARTMVSAGRSRNAKASTGLACVSGSGSPLLCSAAPANASSARGRTQSHGPLAVSPKLKGQQLQQKGQTSAVLSTSSPKSSVQSMKPTVALRQVWRPPPEAEVAPSSWASLDSLVASAMSLGMSRAEALQATLRSRPAPLKPAATQQGPQPEGGLSSGYSGPNPMPLNGKETRSGSSSPAENTPAAESRSHGQELSNRAPAAPVAAAEEDAKENLHSNTMQPLTKAGLTGKSSLAGEQIPDDSIRLPPPGLTRSPIGPHGTGCDRWDDSLPTAAPAASSAYQQDQPQHELHNYTPSTGEATPMHIDKHQPPQHKVQLPADPNSKACRSGYDPVSMPLSGSGPAHAVAACQASGKSPGGPFQEQRLTVLPLQVGKQDLQDQRRLQPSRCNPSCRPGVTPTPSAEPPSVAALQTNPAFDLHEALPQDAPLLNNPTFEGIGTLACAKRPLAAAPTAVAAGIAVGSRGGAQSRMGVHAGFLNGTTGYNPALEGSASPLAYQSRNEAFLEGWGDTSGYSPLAVKGSFTSHQHSSLWARSPLFEANHSSARGSPGKPAFLGSLNTAAVPAASPWRSNPACNDAEAQLPAAPSVPQATSSWRGNANFDPAQAADPAFLPFHPKAWAQNRTFEPLAVPPLAPPDAAGRLSHDPWMSNGIFEPGIARGKEGSRIPGQPFMQQLGANQSTGPSGGLPSGTSMAAVSNVHHAASQQISNVTSGGTAGRDGSSISQPHQSGGHNEGRAWSLPHTFPGMSYADPQLLSQLHANHPSSSSEDGEDIQGTAGSSLQGSPHPEPPTDPETILDSRTEIMTAAPPESRSLYSTLVTDIDRDAYTSAGSEADSESSLALRRYLRPAAGAPRPSQLDTPVSSVHLSDSSGDESSPWGAARSGASSVPTFGVSGSPTRSPDRFRHPWAHPTPGSSVASSSAMMSPTLVGPGVVSPTNSSMASAGRGQHHSQESPSQGIGRGGQQRSRDRLGRRTGDLAASPASYEDRSGQEHESPGSDSMRTLPVCDLPDAQGLAPGACPVRTRGQEAQPREETIMHAPPAPSAYTKIDPPAWVANPLWPVPATGIHDQCAQHHGAAGIVSRQPELHALSKSRDAAAADDEDDEDDDGQPQMTQQPIASPSQTAATSSNARFSLGSLAGQVASRAAVRAAAKPPRSPPRSPPRAHSPSPSPTSTASQVAMTGWGGIAAEVAAKAASRNARMLQQEYTGARKIHHLHPDGAQQDGVRQSMTGSNVVGFDSSKADLDVVSTASPIEAMQVDDMQKPSPLHAALAPQASNLEQMQGASGLAVPMQMTVSHERDAQRDESPSTDWEVSSQSQLRASSTQDDHCQVSSILHADLADCRGSPSPAASPAGAASAHSPLKHAHQAGAALINKETLPSVQQSMSMLHGPQRDFQIHTHDRFETPDLSCQPSSSTSLQLASAVRQLEQAQQQPRRLEPALNDTLTSPSPSMTVQPSSVSPGPAESRLTHEDASLGDAGAAQGWYSLRQPLAPSSPALDDLRSSTGHSVIGPPAPSPSHNRSGCEGGPVGISTPSSIVQRGEPPSQWEAHGQENADTSSDSCPSPHWNGHLRRAPGSYSNSDGDQSSGSYTPTSSSGSAAIGRRPLSTIEEVDSDLQCSPLGRGLAANLAAAADGHTRGNERANGPFGAALSLAFSSGQQPGHPNQPSSQGLAATSSPLSAWLRPLRRTSSGPKELASPPQAGPSWVRQGSGQRSSSSGSGLATSSAVSDTEPDSPRPQAPTLRTPGRIPRDLMRSFRSRPRSRTSPRQHASASSPPQPSPSQHQANTPTLRNLRHVPCPHGATHAQAHAPELMQHAADAHDSRTTSHQQLQQQFQLGVASHEPVAPDDAAAESQPTASWQLAQGVAERSTGLDQPDHRSPQQRRGWNLRPVSPSNGGWGASIAIRNAATASAMVAAPANPTAGTQNMDNVPLRASQRRRPHARQAAYRRQAKDDDSSSSSEQSSEQSKGKLSLEDFKRMYKRKAYEEGPSASARMPGLSMKPRPEPESASEYEIDQPLPGLHGSLAPRLEAPRWFSGPSTAAPKPPAQDSQANPSQRAASLGHHEWFSEPSKAAPDGSMRYPQAQASLPAMSDEPQATPASAAITGAPPAVVQAPSAANQSTSTMHQAAEQAAPEGWGPLAAVHCAHQQAERSRDVASGVVQAQEQAESATPSSHVLVASSRCQTVPALQLPPPGQGIFAAHSPPPPPHLLQRPIVCNTRPLLAATRWLPGLGEGIFAQHRAPVQAHLQISRPAQGSAFDSAWQPPAAMTPSQLLKADAGIFASHAVLPHPVVDRTVSPALQLAARTTNPTWDMPSHTIGNAENGPLGEVTEASCEQSVTGALLGSGAKTGHASGYNGAHATHAAASPCAAKAKRQPQPHELVSEQHHVGRQVHEGVATFAKSTAAATLELPEEQGSNCAISTPFTVLQDPLAAELKARLTDQTQLEEPSAVQEELYEEPPTPRLFDFVDPRMPKRSAAAGNIHQAFGPSPPISPIRVLPQKPLSQDRNAGRVPVSPAESASSCSTYPGVPSNSSTPTYMGRFFGSPARSVESMAAKLRLVNQSAAHMASPPNSASRSRNTSPGQASSSNAHIPAVMQPIVYSPLSPSRGVDGAADEWDTTEPDEHVHTPTGSYAGSYTTADPLTDDLSGYGSGTNEGASTIQPISLRRHGSPRHGHGANRSPLMLSTLPDGSWHDGEMGSGDEDATTDGGSTLPSEIGIPSEVYPAGPSSACSQAASRRSVRRALFSAAPLGSLRQTFARKPTSPMPAQPTLNDASRPGQSNIQGGPHRAKVSAKDAVKDVKNSWARRAKKFLQVGRIVTSGPANTLPSPQRLHAQGRQRYTPTKPSPAALVPQAGSPTPPLTPIRAARPAADTPSRSFSSITGRRAVLGRCLRHPSQPQNLAKNLTVRAQTGAPSQEATRRRYTLKKAPGKSRYEIAEGEQINVASAGAQALLRAGSGAFVSDKLSTFRSRPRKPIELYEFEGCPFCRKVREACSILDIDVLFYPCPKDGPTWRAKATQLSGKAQFPFMVDPNTGRSMLESDNIISYLWTTYGDGEVPIQFGLGPLSTISAGLGLLPRAGRGTSYRKSKLPKEPIEIWGYEASPFCKLTREVLVELEIPHLYHTVARNSPKRQAMEEKWGTFQVPYIEDPNTNMALFETPDVNKYLEETYGA
ncbi:hypothetical protein WJX74_001327 [Apatococcus lobatus]|uniref:GST N-terminal domain-containing protein n=2 Tax=Apatococcus TaxID=904362 RepID=A0AAW1RWX9_9CHLO